MKQAQKFQLEIKSVTEEKENEDGSVETSIKVKSLDKPIDENAKPFPINDVVLEKEEIKRENFKQKATKEVRNAANVGKNIVRKLTYWKEAQKNSNKVSEEKTITINDQTFTVDEVKAAFKSSEDLKSLTGKVSKSRLVVEVEKLDNDALDALLLELDK